MFNTNSIFEARIFIVIVIGFVLSGCSSTSELFRKSSMDPNIDADYSIIYYIHADSDYLYHESNGEAVRGNTLVLQTAHEVAKGAKSGEVFIFYQQPERKFLGIFPRRSSRFYHYTNGELTERVEYRHSDKSEDFLTTEALLYQQYRIHSQNPDLKTHFLYYGHEIPHKDGKKYHRTLPEIDVNIESFTKGLQKFISEGEQRIDLIVLSTCNNGSPSMAKALMPISNTLIASPQNLHLSHINSESLSDLESNQEISTLELARSMAEKTFQRLDSEILTAITLSVFDFDVVRDYSDELHSFIESYENLDSKPVYSDYIDCNEIEFFDNERFSNGIINWFKPARFGRRTLTATHSGWGCRPLVKDRKDE